MTNFTTPPGRMVGGSLYNAKTKDMNDRPLTDKLGNPRVEYYFAIAIPKAGETHWAYTNWGKTIWEEGHAAFPNFASNPTFSWKISDGDSQIPNRKNKRPCDNEGWPGCWVIHFSNSFAVKIVDRTGHTPLSQPDAILPGYWIQVAANVQSNKNADYPGVYVNPEIVSLQGYDTQIMLGGQDPTTVGFGQSQLPAHVSQNPVGGLPTGAPPQPGQQHQPPTQHHAPPAPQYQQPRQPPAPPGGNAPPTPPNQPYGQQPPAGQYPPAQHHAPPAPQYQQPPQQPQGAPMPPGGGNAPPAPQYQQPGHQQPPAAPNLPASGAPNYYNQQ